MFGRQDSFTYALMIRGTRALGHKDSRTRETVVAVARYYQRPESSASCMARQNPRLEGSPQMDT